MFHIYQRAFPAQGQVATLNYKEKYFNVCCDNDMKYQNRIFKEIMESSLKAFKIRQVSVSILLSLADLIVE